MEWVIACLILISWFLVLKNYVVILGHWCDICYFRSQLMDEACGLFALAGDNAGVSGKAAGPLKTAPIIVKNWFCIGGPEPTWSSCRKQVQLNSNWA